MLSLSEPKLIGQNINGKDIFLKNGRFGPYLQFEQEPKRSKTKESQKEKENGGENYLCLKDLTSKMLISIRLNTYAHCLKGQST